MGLDAINMFSLITIASFIMLAPFTLAFEGVMLMPEGPAIKVRGYASVLSLDLPYPTYPFILFPFLLIQVVTHPPLVMQHALIAALCFHTYQQLSYMILSRVTPVTHSIGNVSGREEGLNWRGSGKGGGLTTPCPFPTPERLQCVKRVVVIVAAILLFSTPVSNQNALGTSIALGGVFAYGQVKRSKPIVAEEQSEEPRQEDELSLKQVQEEASDRSGGGAHTLPPLSDV